MSYTVTKSAKILGVLSGLKLRKWKLQEAKSHFSKLVEYALNEGPQVVTKRGSPAVVILSFDIYQKLTNTKEDLVNFFRNSPLYGVELDLERKKDQLIIQSPKYDLETMFHIITSKIYIMKCLMILKSGMKNGSFYI